MSKTMHLEGLPFSDNVRLKLMEMFPERELSVTRGRHYALREDVLYLVRSGPRAVVMPRMAYSEEVRTALVELYGEEK